MDTPKSNRKVFYCSETRAFLESTFSHRNKSTEEQSTHAHGSFMTVDKRKGNQISRHRLSLRDAVLKRREGRAEGDSEEVFSRAVCWAA